MPVHFDKAKGRWRYRFRRRHNGVRYQLTKLLPQGWSRAQAEAYDRTESGRLYAEAAGVQNARLSLAGAVKLYLERRCPELRNGKKAAQDLQLMQEWIEGTPLARVSEMARQYEREYQGKLAPATIRNRLAYVKAAVRFAYRKHDYGDRDYTDKMVLPVPRNERQRYERLQRLETLWRALEPETRALFKLTFYMGLRWRSELLPRTQDDIRYIDGQPWLHVATTKNGQPVMKPVHPAAVSSLKAIPFKHSSAWFYREWWKATKKIGLTDFHPHDLRHSLASVIRSTGGTLEDVRGALHHQSLRSSQRYAHLYPERLQAVMLAIGGSNFGHRKRRTSEK